MAKLRRFFYVASPKGTTRHVMFGRTHTEGLTACGRYVASGWSWWRSTNRSKALPRCADCDRVIAAGGPKDLAGRRV